MTVDVATTTTAAVPAKDARRPRPTALRRGATSLIVVLGAWFLAGDVLHVLPPRTLPPVSTVVATFGDLLVNPYAGETLMGHVGDSLVRWGLGVLVSVLVGVPLGLFMGWSRIGDAVIGPIFNALRSVPPLAWIPLAILWLGTGLPTEVSLVFIAAFPPIVINAYHAARGVDRQIIWAARTAGARSLRQLTQIVIPTELPQLLTGLRIAMGNGLMAVIAAELVSAKSGLGFLIIRGNQDFRPDLIVVGMICISVIGLLADGLLRLATRPLLRWRNTDER